MSVAASNRVVIVGGGVVGLSIAWHLARRGGCDVVVVDPSPGRGASWAAAGMLAPIAEAIDGEVAVLKLGLASNRLYPEFIAMLADESGLDAGYTRNGTLLVARDADESAAVARLHRYQLELGLSAERATSREARSIEPALSPSVRSAVWIADDHQIDNRLFVTALIEACRRSGVSFVSAHASSISADSVTLRSGDRLDCDRVIASTGAWRVPIRTDEGHRTLPVRPVKGQILRLRATSRAVMPTRSVRALDCYLVPRSHGEIAVGATVEERGYDVGVTAGAVLDLLRSAWELVPGIAEAEVGEVLAGLRPAAPDNIPIIGSLRGTGDGSTDVIIAAGHFRHGVLLTPVTAHLVTTLVVEGTVSGPDAALLAPCRADRFELRGDDPAPRDHAGAQPDRATTRVQVER